MKSSTFNKLNKKTNLSSPNDFLKPDKDFSISILKHEHVLTY